MVERAYTARPSRICQLTQCKLRPPSIVLHCVFLLTVCVRHSDAWHPIVPQASDYGGNFVDFSMMRVPTPHGVNVQPPNFNRHKMNWQRDILESHTITGAAPSCCEPS